jgi:hypothetical protein
LITIIPIKNEGAAKNRPVGVLLDIGDNIGDLALEIGNALSILGEIHRAIKTLEILAILDSLEASAEKILLIAELLLEAHKREDFGNILLGICLLHEIEGGIGVDAPRDDAASVSGYLKSYGFKVFILCDKCFHCAKI